MSGGGKAPYFEPWEVSYDADLSEGEDPSYFMIQADIFDASRSLLVDGLETEISTDQLERIVACVNAMEGISDPQRLRDAAARLASVFAEQIRDYLGDDPEAWEAYAALRKVLGGRR